MEVRPGFDGVSPVENNLRQHATMKTITMIRTPISGIMTALG